MFGKFSEQVFDFVDILEASPKENLFPTSERSFGFIEEPGQVLIIRFNLIFCVSNYYRLR